MDLYWKYDVFWTIESAYLMRDYMQNRPEVCKNELIQALKDGKMEFQAFETQPLTELLSAELFRCVEYAVNTSREYNFPVNGVLGDTPTGSRQYLNTWE